MVPADGISGAGRGPATRRTVLVAVVAVLLLVVGSGAGLYFGRSLLDGPDPATTPSPVDIGFSEDMTVHHQQAITMATLAEDRLSPTVRAMARQIERDQLQQVGQMQGWLGLWGAPLLSAEPMSWMVAPGHMGGMSAPTGADQPGGAMPGLATSDELGQLQTASGKELDVLFLQLMVRHHQGGLGMVQFATQHAQVAQVKALGANMAVEESQEIALMTLYLTQDGAKPLPAP